MLAIAFIVVVVVAAASTGHASSSTKLLTDINQISRNWGQLTPYADNDEGVFGVESTGLPDGCQVQQAHTLQRHAQRFPTSGEADGANDERFASKVADFIRQNEDATFTGPLAFLNGYRYLMDESFLTNMGASTEFNSGLTFWNRYGRILYNATAGQVSYNATYQNETLRPKPVLRTTDQSRIWNSQINWALGFFGPSTSFVPNPTLANFSDYADVVYIHEGGSENNTLASYDSCFNDYDDVPGYIGDAAVFSYIPRYIKPATARLQNHAPQGFELTMNDTYAMQSICAYENAYFGQGMSSFCGLFTADEWAGFENTLDIIYYFDYGFGQPTGRAQGIGYVQELLARLQHQLIPTSNSSVNSTLDCNGRTFPTNQPFYADFSHDDILISVLTAMSLDYFHEAPSLTDYPPDPDRHFKMSNLTPFGARLITEVISCNSPDPEPVEDTRMQYYPTQYGWSLEEATNMFIRMRLNHGILPLNTIRGGMCDNSRPDGMCAMADFIASQKNATALANYDFAW